MKRPNIIVHLDVTPEESLRRINLRSRDCESNVSIDFLRALHAAYEEFIEDIARAIPVIKVDKQRDTCTAGVWKHAINLHTFF